MNENELKTRLQRESAALSEPFSEELCRRIMSKIHEEAVHSPKSFSDAPQSSFFHRQTIFHYAAAICCSILIGIGIWPYVQQFKSSNPLDIHQTAQLEEKASVTIPAAEGSSIEVLDVSEVTLAPVLPNDLDFRLESSSPQELTAVLLPGNGVVQITKKIHGQTSSVSETELEEIPSAETITDLWDKTSSMVSVPITWIFAED